MEDGDLFSAENRCERREGETMIATGEGIPKRWHHPGVSSFGAVGENERGAGKVSLLGTG